MTMRRLLALLVVVFLGCLPAQAVEVRALSAVKGAQVWLAEDHTVPVIAMSASLTAGSASDPAVKAGLAAMAAALLEEGAGRFDSARSSLDDHDIQLTADTDRDRLTVSLKVLPGDAKTAFRLLGLALSQPRFDYEAVTRLRLSMMQAIDLDREDPAATAWDMFHSFYFGPHPYGHALGGAKGSLAAISRDDLLAFVKTHWGRAGLKVAIAGDVSPAQATELVRSAFAALPMGNVAPPPPPPMVGAPGLHVMEMEVAQSDAVFALPGLRRSDKDFLAALVANAILGGTENSRLSRELREKRGLTYDVSTDLVTYAKAGIWAGEVQTEPRDMRNTLAIVRETLRKFALEGPTRQEVADAKSYLSGSFALGFTSNEDIARTLVGFMENGLPIDYMNRHAGLVSAVSYDDVRRVAHRLFASERLTIVVAGKLPKEKRSSNPFRD